MGKDSKSSTGGGSTISAVSTLVAGTAPCTPDKERVTDWRCVLIDEQSDLNRTKSDEIYVSQVHTGVTVRIMIPEIGICWCPQRQG